MKALGFRLVSCGLDGPLAKAKAYEWEAKYQAARKNPLATKSQTYPPGSVGDGFAKFRLTETWKTKKPRTREDWERGWKYIEPVFGDVKPKSVTLHQIDAWYAHLRKIKSDDEAGRAVKTWRSLWAILAAQNLCNKDADPSAAIRKKSQPGRSQIWSEGEIVRLVKQAYREGYWGLACIIAIAWDTQFSPVDVRQLSAGQMQTNGTEIAFALSREKTDKSAFGILSARTHALVEHYLKTRPAIDSENDPLFVSKGHTTTTKGGRPRPPVPYTKDSLSSDFAKVRTAVFGNNEDRRFMDIRRSGAVEANAGGASIEAVAAKMANSIDRSSKLRSVYQPVDPATVREADRARIKGRNRLALDTNRFGKLKLTAWKS
jgi:hypothetical protein